MILDLDEFIAYMAEQQFLEIIITSLWKSM